MKPIFTIRNKLLLGFLSIVLIFVLFLIFTSQQFKFLGNSVDDALGYSSQNQMVSELEARLAELVVVADNFLNGASEKREHLDLLFGSVQKTLGLLEERESLIKNLNPLLKPLRDNVDALREILQKWERLPPRSNDPNVKGQKESYQTRAAMTFMKISEKSRELKDKSKSLFNQKMDDVSQVRIRTQQTRLFFSIFVLAISIAIALFLARTVSRPIELLQRAAQDVGKGVLDVPLEIHSSDEIGQLAHTFQQMVTDLNESRGKIEATLQQLSVQKDHVARTAQALKESNEELGHLKEELEKKVEKQVEEIQAISRLKRYLAPQVVQSITSDPDALTIKNVRKFLTIFSSGIHGFPKLEEETEPEELVKFLNDYHTKMVEILFKYGGSLDKVIGDTLLASFGDSTPMTDHAERAVMMSLEMREVMSPLFNAKFPKKFKLGLAIGINTGYVTMGHIGSEMHMDYTMVGSEVIRNRKLQEAAEVNQILITEKTLEEVRESCDVEKKKVSLGSSLGTMTAYQVVKIKEGWKVKEYQPILQDKRSGDSTSLNVSHMTHEVEAPITIGPYRVISKIGEGGMATVYKGFDAKLKRFVALKLMSDRFRGDIGFLDRFKLEAQAVASINHPNVVQIYFTGEKEGVPFFVMELVEGGSVRDLLTKQGSLPPEEAVNIILQAARGLNEAKRHGIIHRDVKPDNMMLTKDRQVKITDFGMVRRAQGEDTMHLTKTGIVVGTVTYMSPEQSQAKKTVDFRSDMYSLGATFFHILVGRPPFEGNDVVQIIQKHREEAAPHLTDLKPGLPPLLEEILQKMMAKKPEHRYASYEELIEVLSLVYPISENYPSLHSTPHPRNPTLS